MGGVNVCMFVCFLSTQSGRVCGGVNLCMFVCVCIFVHMCGVVSESVCVCVCVCV